MFDIKPIDVDVPTALAPLEEVNSIVHEFELGNALREVALYRLWRMWRDGSYALIYSDDPTAQVNEPRFGTFGDFVKFFTENIDVSRAKIYSRLKVYSLLEFVGFDNQEMVRMMATKPTLYERALNMIFIWDQEARVPTGLKTDYFGEDVYDEATKQKIKDFLSELGSYESVQEALAMLSHDILGKPTIQIYMSGDKLVVSYSSVTIDADSEIEIMGENGEVSFEPTDELPGFVKDELQKKFVQR